MMAHEPRVVAELGRPETPEETAARKAEFSRTYRASQNTRNLVAALLVTLAIVAVVVFAVPRGTPPARESVDVAAVAADIADTTGRTVIVPTVPDEWHVNLAQLEGDTPAVWNVVYVPTEDSGFVRFAQGFDADPTWPTQVLQGADDDGTLTIEGVEWTRYDISDPGATGNVTAALSTIAGADTILVYGSAGSDELELIAASVADQVRALEEDPR
jgi:hypothetical protein